MGQTEHFGTMLWKDYVKLGGRYSTPWIQVPEGDNLTDEMRVKGGENGTFHELIEYQLDK